RADKKSKKSIIGHESGHPLSVDLRRPSLVERHLKHGNGSALNLNSSDDMRWSERVDRHRASATLFHDIFQGILAKLLLQLIQSEQRQFCRCLFVQRKHGDVEERFFPGPDWQLPKDGFRDAMLKRQSER